MSKNRIKFLLIIFVFSLFLTHHNAIRSDCLDKILLLSILICNFTFGLNSYYNIASITDGISNINSINSLAEDHSLSLRMLLNTLLNNCNRSKNTAFFSLEFGVLSFAFLFIWHLKNKRRENPIYVNNQQNQPNENPPQNNLEIELD